MLEVIWPIQPRISDGEERIEEIEGLGRAGVEEAVPGELLYGKVAGVELGELAHVERDALFGLRSADDPAVCDGVLAVVLRYDVVFYGENQRRLGREFEVAQGLFDVDEAEHLVGFDPGFY